VSDRTPVPDALPFQLVAPVDEKRRTNDAYFTTVACAEALTALLPIASEDDILEPSCGGGSWIRAIRGVQHVSSRLGGASGRITGIDINPHSRGLGLADDRLVGDFLMLEIKRRFAWTIGNPPFARDSGRKNKEGDPIPEPIVDKHVEKALTVSRNVAFLLRAAIIESDDRTKFWDEHPARHTWFLGQRPSFKGGATDNSMYGFFWWDADWTGPSTWSRLNWR
jgi:hypothetical protein